MELKSSWHSSTLSFGSQEDEQDIIIVSLIKKKLIFLFGLTDEFKPHCKWKLFKKRGLIIHEYDELFLCGFMTNM